GDSAWEALDEKLSEKTRNNSRRGLRPECAELRWRRSDPERRTNLSTDALARRVTALRSRLARLPQNERNDLLKELDDILKTLGVEDEYILRQNGDVAAGRELGDAESCVDSSHRHSCTYA